MTKPYDHAVFIGRFQPFHTQHLEVAKKAFDYADHLILFIGSIQSAPDIRNPWSFDQRKAIVAATLDEAGLKGKYTILGLRDYYYSDNEWVLQVQRLVKSCSTPGAKITLIGFKKDSTSYYLNLFPKWGYVDVPHEPETIVNATDIRKALFEEGRAHPLVGKDGRDFLLSYTRTADYFRLKEEWKEMADYKDMYAQAQAWVKEKHKKILHPPTHYTTDAVIFCGGHVLVVRRGAHPGKGLIALPGGFVGQDELTFDACMRELKEETRIKLPPGLIAGSKVAENEFSHPQRSVRGRTVTHAYGFQLNERELPRVKGGDDAAKAWWLELSEVEENPREFFEDHAQIIEYFMKHPAFQMKK